MIKQHPLQPVQIKKMIDAALTQSLRDATILTVAARHALRASEIAGLRVSDVNLKDGRLYIKRLKGSISTSDVMVKEERALLAQWIVEKPAHDLLFPSTKPNVKHPEGHKNYDKNRVTDQLSGKQIYRIFRYYAELTGVPDCSRAPHAFKHSFIQYNADQASTSRPCSRWQVIKI